MTEDGNREEGRAEENPYRREAEPAPTPQGVACEARLRRPAPLGANVRVEAQPGTHPELWGRFSGWRRDTALSLYSSRKRRGEPAFRLRKRRVLSPRVETFDVLETLADAPEYHLGGVRRVRTPGWRPVAWHLLDWEDEPFGFLVERRGPGLWGLTLPARGALAGRRVYTLEIGGQAHGTAGVRVHPAGRRVTARFDLTPPDLARRRFLALAPVVLLLYSAR